MHSVRGFVWLAHPHQGETRTCRLAIWVCIVGVLLLGEVASAQVKVSPTGQSIFAALSASGSDEAWQSWAERPVDLRIGFWATGYAKTNTQFHVVLNSVTNSQTGAGCDVSTNSEIKFAILKPYQDFTLTVQGNNLSQIKVTLLLPSVLELIETVGRDANNQRGYKLYVDGVESYTIEDTNPDGCEYYLQSWRIEVRPDNAPQPEAKKPTNKKRNKQTADDEEIPEDGAPGDGDLLEIGPGKDSSTNIVGIKWGVSLGRLRNGRPAGKLRFLETGTTVTSNSPPFELSYAQPIAAEDEAIFLITNGIPAQIKLPQTFVEVSSNASTWDLRFYIPSNVGPETNEYGFFTNVTGAPFVTWRITHERGIQTTLSEFRNGLTNTSSIGYTNATWTLTRGGGAASRIERRVISFDGPTGDRIETNEVRDGNNVFAFKAVERYHKFDWNWELVSVVTDPDGAALTRTFAYYDDPQATTDYSKLKWIINPDGSWEKREYEGYLTEYGTPAMFPGTLVRILRPWKNVTDHPDDATTANSVTSRHIYGIPNGRPALVYVLTSRRLLGDAGFIAMQDYCHAVVEGGAIRTEFAPLFGIMPQVGFDETRTHTELAGPGLYGLRYSFSGCLGKQVSHYYDLVTAGTGIHWRATALHGENDRNLFQPIQTNSGTKFTTVEGHEIDGVCLATNRSLKEVTIYSQGVSIQSDSYIFTHAQMIDDVLVPMFEHISRTTFGRDSLGHLTNVTRIDPVTSAARILYSANWIGADGADGIVKNWDIDETGIQTLYTYDALRRITSITRKGIAGTGGYPDQPDLVSTNAYNANDQRTLVVVTAGALSLTNSTTFDLAKRPVSQTDTNGTTTFTYANGGRIQTVTYPGGRTAVTELYLDQRTNSVTGTADITRYYDYAYRDSPDYDSSWCGWIYGLEGAPFMTKVHLGATNSPRWTISAVDHRKREFFEAFRSLNETNTLATVKWYDYSGRISMTWRPIRDSVSASSNVVDLLYQGFNYDRMGATNRAGILTNGFLHDVTSALGFTRASADRMIEITEVCEKSSGHWFKVSTTATFLTDNNAAPTTAGIVRERLTGFVAGVQSEVSSTDVNGVVTTVTMTVDRDAKKVTETTTSSTSQQAAVKVAVNGLLRSDSSLTVTNPAVYFYDGLGRQTQVRTPQGQTNSTTYDSISGQVTSKTDAAGNVTTFEYYPQSHINANMLKASVAPGGKKTRVAYNSRGQVTHIWGDVPFPELHVYDDFGDLTELHTFRGGTGWNGEDWPGNPGTADITRWTYHGPSGLLLEKTDAQNRKVTYTYWEDNRPKTRTWARLSGTNAIVSTNFFNRFGDPSQTSYSDGTPSVVLTNYNRQGLPRIVTDGTGAHTLAYDTSGRLLTDTVGGLVLTNHYDATFGRDLLRVDLDGTNLFQQTYGYDTATGRLLSATAGDASATYAYLADSDLVQTVTFKNSGTNVLTTTRTYEFGSRLKSIGSTNAGGQSVSSLAYDYDAQHRRTRGTKEDGSWWDYGYDDRSELTSGKRFWGANDYVAGQQYEFGYDSIGNRTTVRSGGSPLGANLREATYTASDLNQYTSRTVPGYLEVQGSASTAATVTVNGEAATRQGEYFRKELAFDNTAGPLWPGITNIATIPGGGPCGEDLSSTNTGNLFLAQTPESFTHDEDGNLTGDGRWLYVWDAENRLTSAESTGTVRTNFPALARKLLFSYDHLGRRAAKTVYAWDSTNQLYTLTSHTRFVCDGWNLVAELDVPQGTNAPVLARSYLWGLDLSASLGGAGGIGGLLAVSQHSTPGPSTHFPTYDGNGNVTALVNAGSGQPSARYEYAPFGELLRLEGDAIAKANPFRFSTKFADNETGLLYYGYRYYQPTTARWLNRDPIEEEDARNLYAFVGNMPVNRSDVDGRMTFGDISITSKLRAGLQTGISWFMKHTSGGFRGALRAGGIGGTVGGTWGAATAEHGERFEGFVTGFAVGGIAGLTGGAWGGIVSDTIGFSQVPAWTRFVGTGLSGFVASAYGVSLAGGDPFDGGRGTGMLVIGTGVGAAGAAFSFLNADSEAALDLLIGIAGGTAQAVIDLGSRFLGTRGD